MKSVVDCGSVRGFFMDVRRGRHAPFRERSCGPSVLSALTVHCDISTTAPSARGFRTHPDPGLCLCRLLHLPIAEAAVGAVPGGRDVLERGEGGGDLKGGGGGFGWDPPPPRAPLWSPPKAGRKFVDLNPVGAEGTEAKFWLSASNIGRGEGGGGGGYWGGKGGPGGGGTPASSYGVRPFHYIPARGSPDGVGTPDGRAKGGEGGRAYVNGFPCPSRAAVVATRPQWTEEPPELQAHYIAYSNSCCIATFRPMAPAPLLPLTGFACSPSQTGEADVMVTKESMMWTRWCKMSDKITWLVKDQHKNMSLDRHQ